MPGVPYAASDSDIEMILVCNQILAEAAVCVATTVVADAVARSQTLRVLLDRLKNHQCVVQRTSRRLGQVERAPVQNDGLGSSRARLIERLVAGEVVADTELGYELSAEHLAAVLPSPHQNGILQQLANVTGRRFLSTQRASGCVWAWLGGSSRLNDHEIFDLLQLTHTAGCIVAFGEPAWGPRGFRESLGQALQAETVARRLGRSVRYHDVALLSIVAHDWEHAYSFAERELSRLITIGPRSLTLLETLVQYLEHGHSVKGAAHALRVHRDTVHDRLVEIEELLGHPVATRSAELLVAAKVLALRQRPQWASS